MKHLAQAIVVGTATLAPVLTLASEALAARYACVACHQPERKLVGPSWKDIATKYADGSKTADKLAATIRAGSSGVWGPMPMPAQATVSMADATTLAAWVLQKK